MDRLVLVYWVVMEVCRRHESWIVKGAGLFAGWKAGEDVGEERGGMRWIEEWDLKGGLC
jgi:hypothetical protein